MGIFVDGNVKRNREGVYGGRSVMQCPWCAGHYLNYDVRKQKWIFDRMITNNRARYVCDHCKHGVQYER